MLQTIQMTKVMCDHKDHQGESISSLCSRSQCKERSACCQRCVVQYHQECLKQIVFFDNVPKLVGTIQTLETVYEDLVSRVNQVLKDIKKALDSLLSPIKVYQDSPNLGNLNRLGDLLRSNPTASVPQLIGQAQKVISDQLTNLLLSIQQMEPKRSTQEPSQKDKDEAEKLFKEYQQSQCQSPTEVLNCIERAIQLVPNNEEYWSRKGWCLWWLHRYEDAIESWTTSISIKPSGDAYCNKARALLGLDRLEEAINCLEEGVRQLPNDSRSHFPIELLQIQLKRRSH